MPSVDNPSSAPVRRPLRVAINGTHAKSGGGVTYLRNLLPELAELPDLELHLFLHDDQFKLFYPVHEKVRVTLFRFKPTFFRTLIWEQFASPLCAWGMGADVVFSPANYGPIFGRNHVILLRNAVSVIQFTRRIGSILYWLSLAGATFISLTTAKKAIAVSDYAKNLLSFGMPNFLGRKVAVVHHGTRQVEAGRKHEAHPEGYLLAVSDIYIQKNYHTLLRSHALLVKKFPDLKLFIVGREIDANYARELRQLTRDLNLEMNVVFKGHVETGELYGLYRTCRLFVFPSLIETFGNPLLEAMAVGAPIACSNEAAMPEVLGDTGVMFDPRDHRDMAAQIERLLSDEKLGGELGEKAARRARSFQWRNTAEQTSAVLKAAAEPWSETPRPAR